MEEVRQSELFWWEREGEDMAYALDAAVPSMYEQLGESLLQELSTRFYTKVYGTDVNPESDFYESFGRFFENSSKGGDI
jgi:hypothetical protein